MGSPIEGDLSWCSRDPCLVRRRKMGPRNHPFRSRPQLASFELLEGSSHFQAHSDIKKETMISRAPLRVLVIQAAMGGYSGGFKCSGWVGWLHKDLLAITKGRSMQWLLVWAKLTMTEGGRHHQEGSRLWPWVIRSWDQIPQPMRSLLKWTNCKLYLYSLLHEWGVIFVQSSVV